MGNNMIRFVLSLGIELTCWFIGIFRLKSFGSISFYFSLCIKKKINIVSENSKYPHKSVTSIWISFLTNQQDNKGLCSIRACNQRIVNFLFQKTFFIVFWRALLIVEIAIFAILLRESSLRVHSINFYDWVY